MNAIARKMRDVDTRLDRELQRRRLTAEEAETMEPSAPSLTAPLADDAPLYTEALPTSAQDSTSNVAVPGSRPGTPIPELISEPTTPQQSQGHRDMVAELPEPSQPQAEVAPPIHGRAQSQPPPSTRTGPDLDPAIDLQEPIWGRNYLTFRRKANEIEKNQRQIKQILDTLNELFRDQTSAHHDLDDRVQTMHTHLDTSIVSHAKQALDRIEQLEVQVKSLQTTTQTTQQRTPQQPLGSTQNLDGQQRQADTSAPIFGCDAPASRPPLANPWASSTQPDPWSNYHAEPQPVPQPRPATFTLYGQRGPESPPGITHPGGFLPSSTMGIDHPSQPGNFVQNDLYSSPLGAAIHSEPQNGSVVRIPDEPWETQAWKISIKGFDPGIRKFDGQPEHYKSWQTGFAITSSLATNPGDEF